MLQEAIFLATCSATMATEKTLQVAEGVSHVRNIFSQLVTRQLEIVYNSFFDRHLEIFREQKARSAWLIFTKLRFPGCDGHVTRSNLSGNVAKS